MPNFKHWSWRGKSSDTSAKDAKAASKEQPHVVEGSNQAMDPQSFRKMPNTMVGPRAEKSPAPQKQSSHNQMYLSV